MTGATSNPVRYEIANGDFCGFLKGFWKRNLEWRHFGGSFKHLRSTNNVVFIEEDLNAAHQPNTQFLKWSFGRTHKKQDLVSAYTIQFIPDEQGTFMEWSFEGVTCHGVFKPESSVAIFNFCLQESMVTITYRILDANTMAVCIVDVDSEHTPTIQYGNMYRIDPSKYDKDIDDFFLPPHIQRHIQTEKQRNGWRHESEQAQAAQWPRSWGVAAIARAAAAARGRAAAAQDQGPPGARAADFKLQSSRPVEATAYGVPRRNARAAAQHARRPAASGNERHDLAMRYCVLLLVVLTLIGARDFAGAAKVLSVLYHRFMLAPALCVQTSLEILRRHPEHRDDLLQFYLAAIQEDRLDKRLLLKELWMFYIIQGEFYEAYHLYKDEIQSLDVHEDPRLLANFGILCYWLLFIESSEIREKLKREEEEETKEESSESEDFDDRDGESPHRRRKKQKQPTSSSINQWATSSSSQLSEFKQSIESLIENRYLFKTSIGVHILYQEAASALRRATSLCPTSAQFTEFYVQLLVLVGEIDTACDHLENFYHLNDSDPHAAKMLAGFLEMYYPESTDTQIAVYLRWLKNDPTSLFALEKIMELASAGSIASIDLVHVLLEAVDACGGDLYLVHAPAVGLALWRQLAELLVAMRSEVASNARQLKYILKDLRAIGSTRAWWKRVYFARPCKASEVMMIITQAQSQKAGDEEQEDVVHGDAMMEALIYRAVVARLLFGYDVPVLRALCAALETPPESVKPEHLRLFKSFFIARDVSSILETPVQSAKPVLFRDVPFRHIVHQQEPNADVLPAFQGEQLAVGHVIQRLDVIASTIGGSDARVDVTTESLTNEVDLELVAALEAAVRNDALTREIEDERDQQAKQRQVSLVPPPEPKKHEMALPLYVNLVEEVAFKDRQAPINHIYTFVVETLNKTSLPDVIVPTLMEVENAHRLFLIRWARNEFAYGHPGLLLRYETFLAKFVQPHVHAANRARVPFSVTSAMVDDAIQQMKVQVTASHVHFPTRHEVEIVLRVKAGALLRLRRKVLKYFRHSMKVVMFKLFMFLETRELASLALDVCALNGYDGVVALEDLERVAESALVRIYRKMIRSLKIKHRMYIRDVTLQVLKEEEGGGPVVDVRYVAAKAKEKFPEYQPVSRSLKACVWVAKYEFLHGDHNNVWDHPDLLYYPHPIVDESESESESRKRRVNPKRLRSHTEALDDTATPDEEEQEIIAL